MTNNKKSSLKIAEGLPLSYYINQLKTRTDLTPDHRKRLKKIIENPRNYDVPVDTV